MALAGVCAGDQGKYWEMRDALLKTTALPSESAMADLSKSFGLDQERFGACLTSSDRLSALKRDAASARNAGVYSTPSFLVGRIQNGKIQGTLIVGAMSAEDFGKKVDASIAKIEENSNVQNAKSAPSR
jgi:predicted DsbA family dithiol-disulfide isomerase